MPSYQRRRNAHQLADRVSESTTKEGEKKQRFAVIVAYDGTDFNGFQSQPNGNTIQDKIEYRLSRLLRRNLRIFGCSRTDCGVHANGAVFHVDLLESEVARLSKYGKSDSVEEFLLNVLRDGMPTPCIQAKSVTAVNFDFDAKFSAIEKQYVYEIACGYATPFNARYLWQITDPLDIDSMRNAANLLSGEHNFEWLSVVCPGEERSSIRKVHLEVQKHLVSNCVSPETTVLKIIAKSDAFLYKMVRRIVGLLVNVGKGKLSLEELAEMIELMDDQSKCKQTKIHEKWQNTAPSSGLFLDKVSYDIQLD